MPVNASLDDDIGSPVDWMPAHTAAHDIGIKCKSDGMPLTAGDRQANDRADSLAKSSARAARVSHQIRTQITQEAEDVSLMAAWLAEVTMLANHFPMNGTWIRDTCAVAKASRRVGHKRKAETSEPESVCERLLKLPRIAALRQRVLARGV